MLLGGFLKATIVGTPNEIRKTISRKRIPFSCRCSADDTRSRYLQESRGLHNLPQLPEFFETGLVEYADVFTPQKTKVFVLFVDLAICYFEVTIP